MQSAWSLLSFGVAFVASALVLLALASWSFFDASFPELLYRSWSAEWSELRPRILSFSALAIAGVLSTLLLVCRLFIGEPQGRSVRALLMAVLLAGLWLAFFVSWERISEAGFRWRVVRRLPEIKSDAAILINDWPTENGTLPSLGDFAVDSTDGLQRIIPIRFIKPYSLYPVGDPIGPWVERTRENGVIFFINGLDSWVEYRPDDSEPDSYANPVPEDDIHTRWELSVEQLEPHWFFVQNITAIEEMKKLRRED